MEPVIFCSGNERHTLCKGVQYLKDRLGLIFKYSNPVPKYLLESERLRSLPTWISTGRRQELASFGYYAVGISESLRCFYCHALADQDHVNTDDYHPRDLHNRDGCDFIQLAMQDNDVEHKTCAICANQRRYHYTLLPCGHSQICYRCALLMSKCPLCNDTLIYAIVKTY